MTCKDCLFYDFCNDYNEYPEYVQHCEQTTGTEFNCSHFKEKYRFVELPCKVGDYVEWDNGICLSLKQVRGFLYFEDGLRYILEDCEPFVTLSNIKRIVPREEAEKALEGKEEKTI